MVQCDICASYFKVKKLKRIQLPTCRWDTLEDFVIYGLIMLGLIISPTTIFNGTPLYCTPCISVSGANHQ